MIVRRAEHGQMKEVIHSSSYDTNRAVRVKLGQGERLRFVESKKEVKPVKEEVRLRRKMNCSS